ncbi:MULTISPECIES: Rha family transcriptional regulator [unclassified Mameliella]|uniref:Rha family transcriptional regulator n=1 Tax=unclassified Mameliella TaxID=2630630 RepID=UPI00273D009C|nr:MULTISPECIES: phage regulatory protein/antirepressor Ant [unclassified Mameliella]
MERQDINPGAASVPSIIGAPALTMSSREIAELCEKQHKHVLRDIETMLGQITEPNFGPSNFLSSYTDSTGRSLKEYRLPKDLTVTLITGYRADLRYKVVKRLEELEGQAQAAPLADLSDPAVLVPLLTTYAQRTQVAEAKVNEMSPKAEAFDRLDVAEGNLTVRPASKVLNYPERKLTRWMELNRWAFRQNGKGPLQAYVEKRNAGYLDHRLRHFDDPKTGEPKVEVTLVITPKGLAKLAKVLPKDGAA